MSLSVFIVLGSLVGVALLILAVIAVRHPAARRLAVRSPGRRPTETILVIAGSLLGTAIITGSMVVGDSLTHSIQSGAFTQLGPVDETVTAPRSQSLPEVRDALAALEDSAAVDGVAFGMRSRGTVAARVGTDASAVHPDALLLELDFEEVASFGGDPRATGLRGVASPGPGEAAVSSDLAADLGVDEGDQITVHAYGQRHSLEATAVLPHRGLAGYSTGLDAQSFNLFVAPGTLAEWADAAPEGLRAAPPVALGFVSNRGGVLEGAEWTHEVTELIRERITGMPSADVVESKQKMLDAADEVSGRLTEIFLGIGSFAVLAGVLLLVNVFVMLAQERRSELGIARAMGMQRASLVRAFLLEGALYASAASVLGAVAGIGVGAGIVELAQGISGGPAGFTLDIRFSIEPFSVVGGMLVGLIISLGTILATSIRISRLNIIRAIRELPRPPGIDRPVLRSVTGVSATAIGAGGTWAAAVAGSGAGLLVGPAILAGGLAALLGGRMDTRRVLGAFGLAIVVWGVTAPSLLRVAFRQSDVIVFVIQGMVITGAAVVVLAYNQKMVGRWVRRAVGGVRSLAARIGLTYPLARPFRTTMTLAMYALVVFVLVLVSLFSQVFGGEVSAFTQAEAGGYDLLVESAPSSPLPPREIDARKGIDAVAPLRYADFSVEFRAPGHEEFRRWFASGFDERFLERNPPALDRWLPRFPDEEAVWRHVLQEPGTMIVDTRFLQEGGDPQHVEVGDVVEMRHPITGASQERTVIATMEGGLAFSGAFMSEDALSAVAGPLAPANRMYVAVDERVDPEAIAATLEEEHLEQGVEARTFETVVAERQHQNLRFLRILQGFLVLGLLVGIVGLGVIMVRAVRERRREIGMLRSLGLQTRTVGQSFMFEAGFVALQGIAVGAILGIVTAYQLIENAAAFGGVDVGFSIPWLELFLLLGITLGASVVAAGWPARQASQIKPALALRTAE